MVTVGTQHGFGTHQDLILNKHDQEEAVKYTLIPSGVTLFASAAAKISVAVFLFRLLGRAAKLHHKIILYGASIVMLGANSVSWTFLFGYCDPREKAWKPELDGTCRSGETLDITARVVSGKYPLSCQPYHCQVLMDNRVQRIHGLALRRFRSHAGLFAQHENVHQARVGCSDGRGHFVSCYTGVLAHDLTYLLTPYAHCLQWSCRNDSQDHRNGKHQKYSGYDV